MSTPDDLEGQFALLTAAIDETTGGNPARLARNVAQASRPARVAAGIRLLAVALLPPVETRMCQCNSLVFVD
jgi:hypothetical protein